MSCRTRLYHCRVWEKTIVTTLAKDFVNLESDHKGSDHEKGRGGVTLKGVGLVDFMGECEKCEGGRMRSRLASLLLV